MARSDQAPFTRSDPTGLVTDLSWKSWGGAPAVGSGMAYYDPPDIPVSRAVREQGDGGGIRSGDLRRAARGHTAHPAVGDRQP